MTQEWWPELGPKWEPSTAPKPRGKVIDVHCHLRVPAAADLAMPHFKPEMDPRTFFSPEESLRYNKELRSQPDQVAKFTEPEARIEDMDKQGVDMQIISPIPPQYYYWLEPDLAIQACRLQHERFAEVIEQYPDRFAAMANIPMDHPDVAVSHLNIAYAYRKSGRWTNAEEHFRQALDIRRNRLGKEHPTYENTRSDLVESARTACGW